VKILYAIASALFCVAAGGEVKDDVAMTGPTARSIRATAEAVDDRTIE
jgi:hypothetical protein